MLNNRNIVFNLPRQFDVVLQITQQTGQQESYYNRLCEAVVIACDGNTYMEVRRYTTVTDTEPSAITTYVNPQRWDLIGRPDPQEHQPPQATQ